MVFITRNAIDPSESYGLLAKERSGSVVLHYAVVKADPGDGSTTTCIEYQAAEEADEEMRRIEEAIREGWQLEDVLLVRRAGILGIGEIISLVAAASPASEEAFAACREGIARMKKMKFVRKTER